MHQLPLHYTAASSPRIAMTRMLSDLAMNTPVEDLQIMSIVSLSVCIIPCIDEVKVLIPHSASWLRLDRGEQAAWI